MQKTIGIILVISLLSPLQWAFWSFKIQKKIIKREVKLRIIEGVDSVELTELRFSKSQALTELRWEHAKEFQFKNEMYDVVKKIESADSVVYICWWDHAETKLNKKLKKLLGQSLKDKSESKSRNDLVVRFLTLLFYQSKSFQIDSYLIDNKYFYIYTHSALRKYISSFFIPPEFSLLT